jgi:hypothetical protein
MRKYPKKLDFSGLNLSHYAVVRNTINLGAFRKMEVFHGGE